MSAGLEFLPLGDTEMAINPQIPLMAQGVDLGQALLSGLQGAQSIQAMQQAAAEQPLRQQALEQSIAAKQYEADLLKSGVTASKLKPFIAAKDYDGFAKELQRSGLSAEDIGTLDTYARANRWDQLGSVADQYIQTARDAGVFQRDYGATGADGYVPGPIKLFEYRNKLKAAGASEQDIQFFENAVAKPQFLPSGGGTYTGVSPLTGRTQEVDFTGGAGATAGTGAGGGQLPSEVNVPPPTGSPDDQALGQSIPGDSAAAVRSKEAALVGTKQLAQDAAKNTALLQDEANRFLVNKAGFDDAYPDFKLSETLAKAPNSKLGQIFSQGVGNLIQGVPEVDADFELGQVFRAAVGLIPFPPGAQSQAEQEAREKEVGNLTDAKVSKDVRLRGMRRLLDREQAKARARWNIVNDERKRLGLDEVPNPFIVRRPGGEPMGGMTQPAATGQPRVRVYNAATGRLE
jgi:hypothetical protein